MDLTRGTRIGPYEIIDPLGAGGMGEVWLATDPRLQRNVAIKALSSAVSRDPSALARFEREARFLAALNHPNVASIHGLEEVGDERFIVMELVPGDTLQALIARGPLPLRDALRIGAEIASGLEAAHDAGIIHRDLKPANIKVTADGRVKILDFGIARPSASETAATDTQSPTVAGAQLTDAGSVIGTPSYMSPEQLRGDALDRRTDIWSFGCVLFEMLAGRRPWAGATFYDIVAAIETREPDWSLLPAHTPEPVRHILRRCLQRDPHERLRDAADLRLTLEDARAGFTATAVKPVATRRGSWVVPAVAIAFVVTIALLVIDLARRPSAVRATAERAPFALSQVTSGAGIEEFPSWSPDGKQLVYCSGVSGVRKLFLTRPGTSQETQLTSGSFDDIQPAWSRDGKQILFVRGREAGKRLEPTDVFGPYEGGDVWTIDLATHGERKVLENAFNPSMSPDGSSIAVDASWAGPRRIWIVNARGLNPQQITSDPSEAVAQFAPRWSPDSTRLVFQNVERTKFDIREVQVSTRQTSWITNDIYMDVTPVWSSSGKHVYFSSFRSGGMNIWRVAVNGDGALAGQPEQVTSGAGQDVQLAAAPAGDRMAFATLRQNADLWRMPIGASGTAAGPPEPLIATSREDSRGAWSPDGSQIAFNSDRGGSMNIWLFALRDGATRQLTSGPGGDFQPSWSPDGGRVCFFSARGGSPDIWVSELSSGKLTQMTRGTSLDINPAFSPAGDLIAYQSDAGGRLEVWVVGSDGRGARQLTTVGVSGHFLRWTSDGSVVFRCPCGGTNQLMKVSLKGGEPQAMAALPPGAGGHISFSPDGLELIDVIGHKVIWRIGLTGAPVKLFSFPDADVRIDYPVWSPDGKWLLFDRFRPEGGDVWMIDHAD